MPKRTLPRIKTVSTAEKPFVLRIEWQSGVVSLVDVSAIVGMFRVYEPLRNNPHLFQTVQAGEFGTDVSWSQDIDMSADTLWRLAQEQSGLSMSPQAFRNWRERKAYTLESAAAALGLSRRMVAYYEHGDKPIPRVVALATRALDLSH